MTHQGPCSSTPRRLHGGSQQARRTACSVASAAPQLTLQLGRATAMEHGPRIAERCTQCSVKTCQAAPACSGPLPLAYP